MKLKKGLISLVTLTLMCLIPVFFQNCASSHDSGSDKFSSSLAGGQCDQILINAVDNTGYWDFVKTNCADCHYSGGVGSGAFADANFTVASQAFMLKGEEKIAQFSTSNHKAGYTGPQHIGAIEGLSAAWATKETEFVACKQNGGSSGIGGGEVEVPDKFTIEKPYQAAAGDTITMSWDLTSEMEVAANNVAGVSFEMDMEGYDLGPGLTGYYFYNPRLIVGGAEPIYVRGVGVRIGGAMVANGTTWYNTDRYVPAADQRNIAPEGGAIVWSGNIAAASQVSLGFTELVLSPIDFQPVTWDDLTNAGGIFQVSCQGCHGAAGGVGVANGDYNSVIGGLGNAGLPLVQKYNPAGSHLYERMISVAAPMPTAGLLPAADRNRVRDWILDGAPEDANDVDDMR